VLVVVLAPLPRKAIDDEDDDDNVMVRRGRLLIVLVVVVVLAPPARLGRATGMRIAGRGYKAGRFTYVGNAALRLHLTPRRQLSHWTFGPQIGSRRRACANVA
jgi:hypothetical protein